MLEKFFSNALYKSHRESIICFIDLVIVAISAMLAYWINNNFRIPDLRQFNFLRSITILVIMLIIYTICFMIFKVHRSLWKYVGPVESFRIGCAVVLATIVLLGAAIGFRMDRSYLSIIVSTGLLTILFMFNIRLMYRLYRSRVTRGDEDHRSIIIGAGDAGYLLLKELLQNESFHENVIGFIDDKRQNTMISGYKVLGDTYDIPAIVTKYKIKTAYIAIPSASKEDIRKIYDICQSTKLVTKIMKNVDSLIEDHLDTKHIPVENISIEDLLGRGEIKLEQKEIESYLSNRVIAVTGAGGSIGSELCRQIVKFCPRKLVMIDINENSLYMLEQEFNRDRVHGTLDKNIEILSLIVSIRDYEAINNVLATHRPEVVFHAAAHKHVPLMETRPMEAIKNNIFGTENVIKACIANKVSRFIIISTDKAVNPTNVMGATKRMTEMMIQAYGGNGVTKMAAVRFGNVLGSSGSVIPIFKAQIAEGGPVTITDKKIIRYFMTITEAAQLVLQAGFYANNGEIFVLDMGQPVKILDLAEKMIRLSGYKPYTDIDIIEIGLRPGEKMYEELRLDGETVSRTKNDLIFKNNIMDIQLDEIGDKFIKLKDVIDGTHTNIEIKNVLLEQIKD